jgi:hypothetical protein
VHALEQQRAERVELAHRPVDAALGRHGGALLQQRLELRVHVKPSGGFTCWSLIRLIDLERDGGVALWARGSSSWGVSSAPGPVSPLSDSSRVSTKTRSSWLW